MLSALQRHHQTSFTARQVDVYSFGVVLWEICTGRVPTRGRLADPDVPGDCPADILMLIRECMQVRPLFSEQLPAASHSSILC